MTTIDDLLSAAKARLAELEGEAEHLRALIRLYSSATSGRISAPNELAENARRRTRGVSSAWKPLGGYLAINGKAHLDDLESFSAQNSLGFNRTQIRNQMHNWKRRGFLESPRSSVFVVTASGAAEFGVDESDQNNNGADHEPAPLASSDSGNEPESVADARFDPLNPNKAAVPGGDT